MRRFFTVKYQSRGRWYHFHLEALDSLDASRLVMKRNAYATTAQVVREIDGAEFERLTEIRP